MNILVTGASGFIGAALVPHLNRSGHRVIPLRRAKDDTSLSCPTWDIKTNEPVDAVIHLAGENIAQRWTPSAKARIRDSRVHGTESISRGLATLNPHPKLLLCASGIGFYGDRGDEILTEESSPGEGFLPDICKQWEAASAPAARAGIRVVNLRFGVVLDPSGGALGKMLPPFRAGVGGRVGSGKQYWSWVTRDDAVRAIDHALNNDSVRGPVNVVSPTPIRNSDFAKTLARVLHRPAIFPVPGFALRLLLGEMADAALLASARVIPQRLQQTGFQFTDPDFEPALRKILAPR
jgi:uncharacterized protein